MKLLLKAASNQEDSDWGRFVIVELDETTMSAIRRRAVAFDDRSHHDPLLIEMDYQAEISVYRRPCFFNTATDTDTVEADDLFIDDGEFVALADSDKPAQSPVRTGYTCMLIGAAGIAWEAGTPGGPEEVQTFPLTLDELETIYREVKK